MQERSIIKPEAQTGLAVLESPTQMTHRMSRTKEMLDVVHGFVQESFVPGVDFGPADQRSGKDSLLKPGAEKVCKLFGTHPQWKRDLDTWEMLGKPAGTVCYLCEIVDNLTGAVLGTGRGAEVVGNKSRDANKAIKIAEKCALIDAALYTFCLSDRFTQDGGAPRQTLEIAKRELLTHIADVRQGVDSELTDLQWLTKVIQCEFHRKDLPSLGAVNKCREVIASNKYDMSTAARMRGVEHE